MNFRKFLVSFYDDVIYRDDSYLWSNEELKIKALLLRDFWNFLTVKFSQENSFNKKEFTNAFRQRGSLTVNSKIFRVKFFINSNNNIFEVTFVINGVKFRQYDTIDESRISTLAVISQRLVELSQLVNRVVTNQSFANKKDRIRAVDCFFTVNFEF